MALNDVNLVYSYYPDPEKSRAIADAQVYVGVPGLDPKENQKQVYHRQEDGTDVPVSQPLNTGAGGVILINGSPAQIVVDGNYSIKVEDAFGAQKYYDKDRYSGNPLTDESLPSVGLGAVDTIAELRAYDVSNLSGDERLYVSGYYAPRDGGGDNVFIWDASSTETDNGGTIIQSTGVPTGRWKLNYSGVIDPKWFGTRGDGTTNDTAAIQAAYDALQTDEIIEFTTDEYLITGSPSLNFNKQAGIRWGGATFLYDDDGTAIIVGGDNTGVIFEAWFEGRCRVVRKPSRYSVDGTSPAATQLLGIGIKFRNIFTYNGRGSVYVIGFRDGYYFEGDSLGCTSANFFGLQSQDCLIDFHIEPTTASGSYITALNFYGVYTTYGSFKWSDNVGTRHVYIPKVTGRTTDGINFWGGVFEQDKEYKVYVDTSWVSFKDPYFDSTAGTINDIYLGPNSHEVIIMGGADTGQQTVDDQGTDNKILPAERLVDYKEARYSVGSFTHDLSTTTANNVALNFEPKGLVVIGGVDAASPMCITIVGREASGPSNQGSLFDTHATTANSYSTGGSGIQFTTGSGPDFAQGLVTLGSSDFSVTWTNTGTPTGTAIMYYLAFR